MTPNLIPKVSKTDFILTLNRRLKPNENFTLNNLFT